MPDPSTTIGYRMASEVTYTVDEARELVPVVRSALLQVAYGVTSTEDVLRELPAEYLGLEA